MYESSSSVSGFGQGMSPYADATVQMPPDCLIDREHLRRYTLGDPALEREILGLFIAQLPLTLEALKFAATDRDWHMAAHTLKGSARAVGASELARLALDAEKTGRCAGSATTAIIGRIEEAVAAVERHLKPAEAA
jgi:HPt (histidine-containing phosphotransfer) domain-containing protein